MCLVLAVAGCTPRPSEKPAPPPPAGWPTELADFTIAWTAEPGIDIVTDGAAIAARAYEESYYLAAITENETYLYPGFADVSNPTSPGGPPGTSNLHPKLGDSDPAVWIGTARHHVLSITRSDRDVTLTACAYLYGSAREIPNRDGYAANVGSDYELNSGIFPLRIGLRAPVKTESDVPPQAGPSRTPSDDVFGGWRIIVSKAVICRIRVGRNMTATWRRASRRPAAHPKPGTSSHACLTHYPTSLGFLRLQVGRPSRLADVDGQRGADFYVALQEPALVKPLAPQPAGDLVIAFARIA